MRQEAIITGLFDDGTAEVVVERASICMGNCDECDYCQYEHLMKCRVKNPISAPKGAHVYIETEPSLVISVNLLLYLFPLILFFVGYLVSQAFGLTELYNVLFAFLGLVIGLFVSAKVLKIQQKKEATPTYITQLIPRN